MTNEDKQLLLTDLCARLPYNVVVRCTDSDTDYNCFLTTDILHEIQNGYEYYDYKPYLRSTLSMTEEELYIIESNWAQLKEGNWLYECVDEIATLLNSHHFDYRGLIEKGLALEAPKEMYKTE